MSSRERVQAGFACAALANTIQMAFLIGFVGPLPVSRFVAHAAIVVSIHTCLALVFGGGERTAWAAGAVMIPIVLALTPGDLRSSPERTWLFALIAVSLLAWFAWVRLVPRAGAPLTASAVGAVAGVVLMWIRVRYAIGFRVGWAPLATAAFFVAVLIVIAMAAGGWPRWRAVERRAFSAAYSLPAFAVGAALALLIPAPHLDLAGVAHVAEADDLPPVVLIVLDTVRAQNLSVYGYARRPMPRLDQFAREDAVVRRARANAPLSLPSHASMFTGLYPPRHGAHRAFPDDPPGTGLYALPPEIPTLAELLDQRGYATVGVTANFGQLSEDLGLSRGFGAYSALPDWSYLKMRLSPWALATVWLEALPFGRVSELKSAMFGVPYRRAELITDEAIQLLDGLGEKPYFLFVNYADAHSPYSPPTAWLRSCGIDTSTFGLPDLPKSLIAAGATHGFSNDQADYLVSLYDCELSYLDSQLGLLLDRLAGDPRWDEMLVIITSDHGESLGENGVLGHGTELSDEQLQIPMIIKPGTLSPPETGRSTAILQSADVFPLVLLHAGIEVAAEIDGVAWGRTDGVSFAWAFDGDRSHRAVQRGGRRLVVTADGEVQLSRVDDGVPTEDRGSGGDPELRAELLALLDAIPVVRFAGASGSESDALQRRLRALGYLR